jgi:peroxiredoxin Q/BCP
MVLLTGILSAVLPTFATAPAASTPVSAPASDTLAVGRPAPDFTLPAQDGKPVGPKDVAGRWVVLYFYPKDFTGGCSLEARNFQKDSAAYAKADAVILGVSTDTPKSHEEFCAKEGLGFKLLADTAGVVSARYGSLGERDGKKLSRRNTFLLDPQGRVAFVFRDVRPASHSKEVLAALAVLRAERKQ